MFNGNDDFSEKLAFDRKFHSKKEVSKNKNFTYHCKSESKTHWIELVHVDMRHLCEYITSVRVEYFFKNSGKGYRKQRGRKSRLKVYKNEKGAYIIFHKQRRYL